MTSRRYSKLLSLTGFMGCGKSTVGRLVAEKLGIDFIDLDSIIEERTQSTIPEIFAKIGEYGFRSIERMTLETILNEFADNTNCSNDSKKRFPAVLALGGGTLTTPECGQLVKRYTKCVYLKADVETLAKNLECCNQDRPLLHGCTDRNVLLERINSIISDRSEIYESFAKIHIDISGKTPETVATEIIETI